MPDNDLFSTLSEDKKQEIADYIHRKWSEAGKSSLRQQVIQEAKDARQAYEQEPTSTELWKDAINLVLPFLSISVDQLEPRLVASIVGHDEIVKVDDFGAEDEELSSDIEQMDNAVLMDDVKIKEVVKAHIHDILLDGHVFVAPYWDFKEGKTREFVPAPEEGKEPEPGLIPFAGKFMRESVSKVSDQVKLDLLDTEKVFFPDQVDDWEDAPVVYEHFISWGEYTGKVKRKVAGWVKHDEEDEKDLGEKVYTTRPDTGEELSPGQPDEKASKKEGAEKLKAELRCLRGNITYDIDDDGIEEKLVCTIEEQSKKILYLIDNAELDPLNRKQIRCIRLMPRSKTGYGYGLHAKLKAIQEGGSNTMNLLLNSCILQMMPVTYYEEAAGFKTADIEWYPGAHIPVGDVTKIKQNEFSPQAAAFKDLIEIFFRIWQYIIVMPDYNVGQDPKQGGSTATGVLALLQEASISHDYWGATLHDQYTELFKMIHDLCYLNMDPAREIDTLGHEVSQRVLSNSYKIRLVATTKSANRHVERLEMQEALAIAEKGAQVGVVVPDEPIRDYLQTFRGLNVEKWMNAPISQVCARMRGPGNGKGQGQDQGADPFGPLVMQLLQMPPEALGELMRTLQIGKAVRDDVTELAGGPVPDQGQGQSSAPVQGQEPAGGLM